MKIPFRKTLVRGASLCVAVLALAACSGTPAPQFASRGGGALPAAQAPKLAQAYRVHAVRIVVPRSLRVSEANSYYPKADIVWRGDPPGDRYEQVKAIFEAGLARGAQKLTRGRPADVEVELLRFHSLTEKTRYTVGGTHSIKFRLTLRDPASGAVLESRVVHRDLKAYGGSKAMAMEARGLTQKVRITQHLANVLVDELGGPAAGS